VLQARSGKSERLNGQELLKTLPDPRLVNLPPRDKNGEGIKMAKE
jgi:hypothetical protein